MTRSRSRRTRTPLKCPQANAESDDEPTLGDVMAQRSISRSPARLTVGERHSGGNLLPTVMNSPATPLLVGADSSLGSTFNNTKKDSNNKNTNKSKPRELPSNRPVPPGRDACLGNLAPLSTRSILRFDPRFEDHCGEMRPLHVERNYAFLSDQHETRRKSLQALVAQHSSSSNTSPAEIPPANNDRNADGGDGDEDVNKAAQRRQSELADAQFELERMAQQDVRRADVLRRRQVLKDVREQQKEAVRSGKRPFFLKERELRRLELRARFDEIRKQKGGVNKFIAKKQRRLTGKHNKMRASTPSSPEK